MCKPRSFIAKIGALTGVKRLMCACFAGAASAFALEPFNILPIPFFTFPILVWLLDGIHAPAPDQPPHTTRKLLWCAARTGWSFGFGYFVFGLWWLGNAMLIDIAQYGWAIPFAVFGLPAFLALYYGLAAVIQTLLSRKGYSRIVALAFAFGVAEWLRGILFTGLPWNAIGYSAMPTPLLMQISAIFGLYGINALCVLVYATPALLFDHTVSQGIKRLALSLALCLIAFQLGFGAYRLHNAPPLTQAATQDSNAPIVRLIQPSIPQTEKIDNGTRFDNFEAHLQLTGAQAKNGARAPDFIIWPETSVPYLLDFVPEATQTIAKTLKPGQLALLGTVRAQRISPDQGLYYNALQVVDAHATILDHADKVHLVPFGEYMPFASLFDNLGLSAIAEVAGGYSAAKTHKSIPLGKGITILPLICYEAIFPTELHYEGPKANLLVNISNDAWFGTSPGPWQHFQQARLRAVEQAIPLARATNNGISAMIDPYGRITAEIGHNEIGFIDAIIPPSAVSIWHREPGLLQAFLLFLVLFITSIYLKLIRRC